MVLQLHTFVCCALFFYATASPHNYTWPIDVNILPRSSWGARPPDVLPQPIPHLNFPVPYVIIHHSSRDSNCSNLPCSTIVKRYQDIHIYDYYLNDISYNFLIDPEGVIYEARGWAIVGAHAKGYNVKSVGICFIGNYNEVEPTHATLSAAETLIKYGIQGGQITRNYTLLGHRQVRKKPTHCPGEKLFAVIKTWSHFKNATLMFGNIIVLVFIVL